MKVKLKLLEANQKFEKLEIAHYYSIFFLYLGILLRFYCRYVATVHNLHLACQHK